MPGDGGSRSRCGWRRTWAAPEVPLGVPDEAGRPAPAIWSASGTMAAMERLRIARPGRGNASGQVARNGARVTSPAPVPGLRNPTGEPVRDASSPAWLVALAPAGNRAIAASLALQREGPDDAGPADTPGGGPLTAAQSADAIRYYTSQPWLYTKAIVEELRTSLGLDAAGGVDEALVQAVATWQQTNGSNDPALAVDGKAGPRTLPRIFQHGLNEEGEGQTFGEAVQSDVIDDWAKLATPEARLHKLVELVNERLAAAGVPAVGEAFDADPVNDGSFDFPTWNMNVGRTALSAAGLDLAKAKDLADTIYHEARHSEQWFRMAQLRAGQGLSAAGITTELGIPARIARLAKADPLAPGSMQGVIAQGWWDSVYGAGSAHREATLTEIDNAGKARIAARKRFNDNPTPANQAALDRAQARFDRVFAAYRNLPEENDAWATGPQAAEGVTSGTEPDEAGEEAAAEAGEAGEEAAAAPAADEEQPAGSPPAAGRPSHEILPEENLP